MKITYISHSGFAVELENHIFLFDYYKGEIPKFDPKKSIVVFASHVHHDHYVEEIFELREQYPDVHYVLSSDIRRSAKKILEEKQIEAQVSFLRIHQELELGKVRIQTLKSTDAGVDVFWWSAKEDKFTMQESLIGGIGKESRMRIMNI